jgi:hypothetical protein
MLVHRGLRRLELENLRQLSEHASVRKARRHVRPLARVKALGEEPAKLVEVRRLLAQEPVRMVVDERDRAQYFRK